MNEDDDYIYCRRSGYSLNRLLERHPDGVPDSVISAVLLIDEDKIEPKYQEIVEKLRDLMGADENLPL